MLKRVKLSLKLSSILLVGILFMIGSADSEDVSLGQVLLGPLSEADFKIYDQRSNTVIYAGTTTKGEGTDISTAGLIKVPQTLLDTFKNKLYRIEVTGGTDIDANDDGVWDIVPTQNIGTLHSLMNGEKIKEGDFKINILNEIVYQNVKDQIDDSQSDEQIEQMLDDNAKELLNESGDINGDGIIDNQDLVDWNPAKDKDKLVKDYDSEIKPIVDAIHNGEEPKKDESQYIDRTEPGKEETAKILFNFSDVSNVNSNITNKSTRRSLRQANIKLRKLDNYKGIDTNDTDFNSGFELHAVTSSKPDEFHLTVTRLALDGTDLFQNDDGKDLIIKNGAIDISHLFDTCINTITGNNIDCNQCYLSINGEEVNSCDKCYDDKSNEVECNATNANIPIKSTKAELSIENKKYSTLQIIFKTKAKIKGCTEGTFSSYSLVPGTHKYCTQSELSTYSNTTPIHTDFKNKTPELMDFALHSVVGLIPERDTMDLVFDISDINISTKPTITLLIDTNRMLRFYNQGTIEAVSPSIPANKAYFYDSVLLNSMFVSLGTPSILQGYEYYAVGCLLNEGESIPTDLSDLSYCENNLNKGTGWLTYIADSNNQPQLINLQGDDEFAPIKGSNTSPEDHSLQNSYFTKDQNGLYNIKFNLNADAEGMIYGFEPTKVNEEQIVLEKFETNDGKHKDWYKVKLIRKF